MRFPRRLAMSLAAALCAVAALALPGAAAAVPQPCGGVPQISDASGDGHHSSSDVLAAWFSEEAGRLQAVIKVRASTWEPEHEDAEENGSGYALIFTVGGKTAYVRARDWPHGEKAISYDWGTYASGTWFTSLGSSTGEAVYASFGGTVTIDVPDATGAVAGALLSDPFVLTYDGITAGVPDWVDQAPGGTAPGDPARGADYRVGSCGTGDGGGGGESVAAVQLTAPVMITGKRRVRVTGKIAPARAGVAVDLRVSSRGRSRVVHLTTGADGSFATRLSIGERTRLRATAEGIGSQTLTVAVRARVRIHATRLRSGGTLISGRVDPALPGPLLLLGANHVTPVARRAAHGRRFSFRLGAGRLEPGRYEVVYVPAGGRAERATSNAVRVRRQ